MPISKPAVSNEYGYQLVNSIAVPDHTLNLLFSALILSSVGTFLGGNLLLLDGLVLRNSAQIVLICLGLLLVFYMLSRVTSSVTWGLVLVYGLMWLVVYSQQAWMIPVVYLVVLGALLYTAKFLRVQRNQWIHVFLMALLAAMVVLGVARAYTSFDMLNRLHADNVFQDTLFHSSISAMIKNYGVTSTGLHGLVETPYHVLSHVLFASISLLSGIGVFEVYGVANWVLFAPLLIFSAVVCTMQLEKANQLKAPLIWSIVCVLFVAVPILLRSWRVSDSFFVSESYLVALGVLLLALPLLFKQQLDPSDFFLLMISAAVMSYAKTSVGLIFAGLWLVRIVFYRRDRARLELLALVLSVVVVTWMVLDTANATQGSMEISPLHYISKYSYLGENLQNVFSALQAGGEISLRTRLLALAAVLSFFIFHFLFSWAVVARAAFKGGILSVFSKPLPTFALASVFAGAAVIILFEIPGGSVYYFSNVAFFVALPGVVALLAILLHRSRASVTMVLILSILIVGLLSIDNYYKSSIFHPLHSSKQHNDLVDSLVEIRDSTPKNLVLQADSALLSENPVSRCSAQPFVFPAISEHPWVNVLSTQNDCEYNNYLFSQYGVNNSNQSVSIQPSLLTEMKILEWSQTTTGMEQHD